MCWLQEKPEHDKTDNVVTEIEYKDTSKVKERDTKSKGRKDLKDEKSWMHLNSSSDDETSTDNSSHDGKKGSSSSIGSISLSEEDEPETTKKPTSYWFLQPPYLKNNAKKPTDSSEALHKTEPDHYVLQEKTTARSVRRSRAKTIESVYDSKTKDAETLGSVEMKTGNRKSYPSEQPEYESRRRNTSRTSYVRGMSLPTEHTNAEETSNSKGHARGVSLDSQMRGGAGRVYPHPNMLDWDDLVARLAALKGK
jgi:vacuolar protein sorting-associated protein IST1